MRIILVMRTKERDYFSQGSDVCACMSVVRGGKSAMAEGGTCSIV